MDVVNRKMARLRRSHRLRAGSNAGHRAHLLANAEAGKLVGRADHREYTFAHEWQSAVIWTMVSGSRSHLGQHDS